jgi:hypothetical protein
MKLSIHKTIRGKPAKDSGVNLGYGWINIDADWDSVFALITQDGVATSAELTSENRKEANFVSRQLIMVDIDNGMTLEDLFRNEFYNIYGAGFYATPSFTLEHHKFRIMFRLAEPETDAGRLRKLNRGLLRVFEQADEACKDPTRIFYGTPDCRYFEQTDKILPLEAQAVLIELIEEEDRQQAEAMLNQPRVEYTMTDERRAKILELLNGCFVGNYPLWRNIGWGLKSGGFSLQDFQYVTQGMMRAKTAQDTAKVWNDGSINGQVTMGSVIHFLKTRLGDDCLQEAKKDWRENRNAIYNKYKGTGNEHTGITRSCSTTE